MDKTKIIKTPILYRTAAIETRGLDEKKRTLNLSFSSEEPVDRWFGSEILSHDSDSVDLSFVDSGRAPLLVDHNRSDQVGVIESARIGSDRKGRATVRFGQSVRADEILQDIIDEIRQNVSVGYQVRKMELVESDSDKGDTYRVIDWLPLETSIVSIPADQTVGVGRSQELKFDTQIINRGVSMKNKIEVNEDKSEKARASDILKLGQLHRFETEAIKAVTDGQTLDQFRQFVLNKLGEPKAVAMGHGPDPSIGMSGREIEGYSFLKVIRAIALGPSDPRFYEEAAFERECSRASAKVTGRQPKGIMVPHDVLGAPNFSRTLTAGTATAGAELVADNLLAGSFIDVLRNLAVVTSLGAYVLDGLVGDVLIPRKTGASAGAWIATEGGDAGLSEATFDQVPLTPKTVGAYSEMTRQLILQSTPAIEALIRDDLAKALSIAIDLAALYGSGASGQPTGIVNQTGINAPSPFAAAVPTWAEVVGIESAVAVDNALLGNLAYIIEPSMRGSLRTSPKETGYPVYVMGDDNRLGGYVCGVTSQVTSGDVFFGNWNDLILGLWGGLDITLDPYTKALSGTIRLIALQSADIAVRHPVSFAFNNDTV